MHGKTTKLMQNELHNLHSLQNIATMIKSRHMRWQGLLHVRRGREMQRSFGEETCKNCGNKTILQNDSSACVHIQRLILFV